MAIVGEKVLGATMSLWRIPLQQSLRHAVQTRGFTRVCRGPCIRGIRLGLGHGARVVRPVIARTAATATTTASSTQLEPHHGTEPTSPSSQGPAAKYSKLVKQGSLRDDPHQRETVRLLQDLYDRLQLYTPPPIQQVALELDDHVPIHKQKGRDDMLSPDFAWIKESEENLLSKLSSFFTRRKKQQQMVEQKGPTGLYLYGDVGTGKTMVMDLFYNTIHVDRKRRVHFHAFMQDVHRRIHQLRTQKGVTYDPLPIIATELANDAWLLCFDELQVTDITDAMILRRLFDELFKRGVVVVTTSNRPPDELYKNGIQRQSFLPCIALFKERCHVHSLNSGIDYRKQERERLRVYFTPLNQKTEKTVNLIFNKLARNGKVESTTLTFLGRSLTIPDTSSGVAKISFQEICGEPHSAADYLEVVRNFHTIILTDIPRMTLDHRNEARRFITFIDTMYENKTRLLISADAEILELFTGDVPRVSEGSLVAAERMLMDDLKLSPEQLTSSIFTGSEEVFAFQRAVSRLIEMQSHQWLGDDLKQILMTREV
ncbi:uncharacterized protein SPPG_06119 [Spizellomyces punctatus DAOM BR117]|uniref:AFG1-like ATPase n=1 Tax=Spizellomyces punctatus (strain DAOM BR117) TaxID=645134 RepID=A0A0L0HA31_SPIPD|nr:uncharacterized protein SPPG_06119 [Spizellomyces punctatus DAOM BR117]KNC98415.1 hypothetical protein SPPG_06119 [Spizellomyces punctatus DAOM BR117]|eukprot:XP_016606455.1 hypothetical protein SPPG_06119 [Spizellomyces punctatus DAOM BR117]